MELFLIYFFVPYPLGNASCCNSIKHDSDVDSDK